MTITQDIRYVGVNDHGIDLFEGMYPVPHGMAYNSYVILDQFIAVMDPVDERFTAPWLARVQEQLNGRQPDYLIVHHMEPDHSANVVSFMEAYPQATVVASQKAFTMMKAFFGQDYPLRRRVVSEGDALSLGEHTLRFFSAPMVHWPEVIMSYEEKDQVLFSADAFGKFGALDHPDDWADEARRYYFGIVGQYGKQVQSLLNKVRSLPLRCICPLHGPVLHQPLESYLRLYGLWSGYQAEEQGVVIAYASVYGHTRKAVHALADQLRERGCRTVILHDLTRCDVFQAVADAFRYDSLVLAATTYNADVFPAMKAFIQHLAARGFRNRKVCLMENGSWAPSAAQAMRQLLSGCTGLTQPCAPVRILSSLNEDSLAQIDRMAQALCP